MNKVFITAIIIIFVAVGGYFLLKEGYQVTTQPTSVRSEVEKIKVEAFRFGYKPDVITIKKGSKIRLEIDNLDTLHGIKIPALGVSGDDSIEFSATQSGKFAWYCNNYCGDGHRQMQGKLIVEE